MSRESYYRQQRSFSKSQAAYDNMQPPEYWEDDEEVIDDEPDFESMLENNQREE